MVPPDPWNLVGTHYGNDNVSAAWGAWSSAAEQGLLREYHNARSHVPSSPVAVSLYPGS